MFINYKYLSIYLFIYLFFTTARMLSVQKMMSPHRLASSKASGQLHRLWSWLLSPCRQPARREAAQLLEPHAALPWAIET